MKIWDAGTLARGCVSLMVAAVAGWCAAPSMQWSAAAPGTSSGLSLAPGSNSHWRVEVISGTPVARLDPVRDYYARAAFLVHVDHPIAARSWLRVQYLDRGYGLIAISYGAEGVRGVPQPKQ
ncbi:MAG TPA: hypothetical protein VN737_15490, partial [Bryobacteraceae bacterium]|nr:hypothetical protein [Bryobacteraceae bacterium]